MRQLVFISALVACTLLAACERHPAEPAGAVAAAPNDNATEQAPGDFADSTAPVPAIIGWGPRKTKQGQAENVQKSGGTGLWIKVTGVALGAGASITFDGKLVKEVFISPKDGVITAEVPLDYVATPGMKPIVLKTSADAPELVVGDFEVSPTQ